MFSRKLRLIGKSAGGVAARIQERPSEKQVTAICTVRLRGNGGTQWQKAKMLDGFFVIVAIVMH